MDEKQQSFTYEIDGKRYTQKKLTYFQTRDLGKVLVKIFADMGSIENATAFDVFRVLVESDAVIEAAAIVLTPEGIAPRDVDRAVLREELGNAITVDELEEIVRDFLSCNPTFSRFAEKKAALAEKFKAVAESEDASEPSKTASTEKSASLPEETSPAETK